MTKSKKKKSPNPPPMNRVVSSNIYAVGYKEGLSELWMQFNNGRVYRYFDVSALAFHQFVSAKSVGSFFHQQIKTHYKCEEVEQDKPEVSEKPDDPVSKRVKRGTRLKKTVRISNAPGKLPRS